MKAMVKTYLNIRSDQPAILVNNNPGYYKPGEEIEVNSTVIGQTYKGNNIWYRLGNNAFVWSGGIEGIEFSWNETDFMALDQQQQHDILLMAKAYYAGHMLSDEYGVTGIYIGKKMTGDIESTVLCLVFQVKEKADQVSWKKIPASLPFKGFSIPTDVVEEDLMEMQFQFPGDSLAGRPGGTLSRVNFQDWGTCSFVAEREEDGFTNFYLVTNYHVAAFDLLRQQKFSYDVAKNDQLLQLVMPSWQADHNQQNKIGFLYKGLFDEWHDTALVRIPDATNVTNLLSAGVKINDVLDLVDDETFLGKMVTMYGGSSGVMSNKKIISVNSSQRGRINGQPFIKNELIQVEKMSNGGDSGSPVLIGDQLIGIIIGADRNNTYVLSAAKIINFFNLKISRQ